jgi:hypothetical protein
LNFELGEGKSAKLGVREGDDFLEIAKNFVNEHNLEAETVEKVF